MRFTCIVCGHKTLDNRCEWDICPICFWEDDVILDVGDKRSSANGQRVSEAQANYLAFGCCSRKHIMDVRQPVAGEDRDPQWQPLPEAIALLESLRDGQHS